MLKLAANLSMLFGENPLLERFSLAARAGFNAVEMWFPYEYPVATVAHELEKHHLKLIGINTPAGDTARGEWGLSALPGREEEARKAIDLAIHYAAVLQCPAIHVMAGVTEGLDGSNVRTRLLTTYATRRIEPNRITSPFCLKVYRPPPVRDIYFPANIRRWNIFARRTAIIFDYSLIFSTPSRSMAI